MRKILPLFLAFVLALQAFVYAAETSADESPADKLKTQASEIFSDVSQDAWYAESVGYCSQAGLMSGVTGTAFAPNDTASRAMLVTVLYRRAGSPAVTTTGSFPDVSANSWYADAVAWAANDGVVNGYSDGRFGGNDPVTREQFVTILYRTEGQPALQETDAFADQSEISSYAMNAVAWAKGRGIISGRGGNRFDPKANITRGEMAAVLYRWLSTQEEESVTTPTPTPAAAEEDNVRLEVVVEGTVYTATLSDTQAAQEFAQILPMTITMDDYGGFEKVGSLGTSLTASNSQTTTTAGDIVLYNSNNIVMFYGSNSWSYTRLGKIDDLTGWADALGRGSVSVTFRLAEGQ